MAKRKSSARVESFSFANRRRSVSIGDALIHVTSSEYRLLLYLALRANTCCSYNQLEAALGHLPGLVGSNALQAIVSRLRRKLGRAARQLVTVTGVGYRLDD